MSEHIEDEELLHGFLDEAEEMLAETESTLASLNLDEVGDEIDAIFRSMHTIKGTSAFFGLMVIQRLTHHGEDVLEAVRAGTLALTSPIVSLLITTVSRLQGMVLRVREGQPETDDPDGVQELITNLAQSLEGNDTSDLRSALAMVKSVMGSITGDPGEAVLGLVSAVEATFKDLAEPEDTSGDDFLEPEMANSSDGGQAVEPKAPEPDTGSGTDTGRRVKTESQGRSIRVNEEVIDHLLDCVGDLVVVADMVRGLRGLLDHQNDIRDLRRTAQLADEGFSDICDKLQKAVMGVRQVSARTLTRKVPSLVRGVAEERGKDIFVEVVGDDIKLDKSHVELLDAPLTHLVRNAADHGIEEPEIRESRGKDPKGRIVVSVLNEGQSIILRVADDGGGLNVDKIREKAEKMGIVTPGAPLGDDELLRCLTAPGFSTADVVTDISGRGVGMDVVRRAIEETGGGMSLTTTAGVGTTFDVRLPKTVTTQIETGYFIRCGEELFVLPLECVREAVGAAELKMTDVAGKGRIVIRRDRSVPVVDLPVITECEPQEDIGIFVFIERDSKEFAIIVHQVVGVMTMVKQPLPEMPGSARLFSGAALRGDGSVALLLDLDRIVDRSKTDP